MLTKEKIDIFLKNFVENTKQEYIKIKTKKSKNLPLTASKFGWIPFLTKETEIPKTEDWLQLFLLAQINCEDLPENNIYPKKWLLQFWIVSDWDFGCDFEGSIDWKDKKILYFSFLENSLTEEEIKKIYNPSFEDDYTPFDKIDSEFALSFEKKTEGMLTFDYRYPELFVKEWNKNFVENQIKEFFESSDFKIKWIEDLWEYIHNFIHTEKVNHKIGWYPFFTQFDPRENSEDLQKYDTLLLQIDSEFDEETENFTIIWWDTWVANFFISKENLEKLDFEKVLYNWDCY